jgi:hypothetical protein
MVEGVLRLATLLQLPTLDLFRISWGGGVGGVTLMH